MHPPAALPWQQTIHLPRFRGEANQVFVGYKKKIAYFELYLI
jgi:hypothetical protein